METAHRRQRIDGFSLLELSIVMIIVGILISAGITVFKPSAVSVMNTKTEAILKANVDALVGFSAVQQRLPTQQDYPSLVRSQKDGFGNNTKYIRAYGLSGLRSVCNTSFTNLSIVPRRGGVQVDNVAFIIQSYGNDAEDDLARRRLLANGSFDVSANSDQDFQEGSPDKDMKIVYIVPAWVGGNDKATAKDDIVEWATLSEIQAAAKCGPALRITVTDLPSGAEDEPYAADVFALGGTRFSGGGNYEWCGIGSLPRGLGVITVSGGFARVLDRSSDCSTTTGSWVGGDYLRVTSGEHYPKGGMGTLTVFVRDNDGANVDQHHYASAAFVLNIPGGIGKEDKDCEKHRDAFDKRAAAARQNFDGKATNDAKSAAEFGSLLAAGQEDFDKVMIGSNCRSEWNWGWGWGKYKDKSVPKSQSQSSNNNSSFSDSSGNSGSSVVLPPTDSGVTDSSNVGSIDSKSSDSNLNRSANSSSGDSSAVPMRQSRTLDVVDDDSVAVPSPPVDVPVVVDTAGNSGKVPPGQAKK